MLPPEHTPHAVQVREGVRYAISGTPFLENWIQRKGRHHADVLRPICQDRYAVECGVWSLSV